MRYGIVLSGKCVDSVTLMGFTFFNVPMRNRINNVKHIFQILNATGVRYVVIRYVVNASGM